MGSILTVQCLAILIIDGLKVTGSSTFRLGSIISMVWLVHILLQFRDILVIINSLETVSDKSAKS